MDVRATSPLIAVTRGSAMDDYLGSIRAAGGRVFVIDNTSISPAEAIAHAAGLLLTGGSDIEPSLFGEAAHPTFTPSEPGRDWFEIELVRRALEAGVPLLAICRGAQVVNVALGGTLIQDIPDQVGRTVAHRVTTAKDALAHDIRVAPGTLLAQLLETDATNPRVEVNSRHHQAPGRLGSGLIASGVSADGVAEAIERTTGPFCLGVQWHPENFLERGTFASLFAGLIRAASH